MPDDPGHHCRTAAIRHSSQPARPGSGDSTETSPSRTSRRCSGSSHPTPCSPTTPPHCSTRPAAATPAVNNLALQALVAAFAADNAIVDESSTRTRSPRSPPNSTTLCGTLTTTASARRPGPRHLPDGAWSHPDIRILNDAIVCIPTAANRSSPTGDDRSSPVPKADDRRHDYRDGLSRLATRENGQSSMRTS